MSQEKFQTSAIVFLVFAVNMLLFMVWQQNVAIANLTKAVKSLSASAVPAASPDALGAP